MSTLQVVNLQSPTSGIVNESLNSDGSVTFNGDIYFAPMQPLGNLQFLQSGTGAVTRTVTSKLQDIVSVKDFGAIGNGIADDTAAIQAAVNSGTNAVFFPQGSYKITSTIDLATNNVALVGESLYTKAPKIFGNFNGFLLDCSGTAPSTFEEPGLIQGLYLENLNNGTAAGSAGCIDLTYTGTCIVRDCFVRFQNTGVLLAETIGAEFHNVFLVGDSGTNPTRSYCRGYSGFGRNCQVRGGRVYGCFICLDIAGDAWNINGLNCEFSEIIIKQGPSSSTLIEGCQFETSKMLFTNADTLPTITTSPWTDNGGTGQGWNGSTTFLNNHVAFTAVGTANGVEAPLFVIKSQPSFTGSLSIIGCTFAVPNNLATISTSFNRTVATSTITGLKVFVAGTGGNSTPGFIDPATIVSNSFSGYVRLDFGTNGAGSRLGPLVVNSDGNVGINFPTPNRALCIGSALSEQLILASTSGSKAGMFFSPNGTTYTPFFGATGTALIWETTGLERFRINGDGSAVFTPNSGGVTLAVAATAWAATSDERLKTDLKPITKGLEKVSNLRAVTGRLKTDEEGISRSFLIAQDVQAVLPEAVSESDDEDKTLSLRYSEVIPLLVSALHDAKDEIDALKARLDALEGA